VADFLKQNSSTQIRCKVPNL